jgi:putative glutamine amidotransferase
MFLRPRVAILGRFSKKASAIRFGAVLSARELVELVELVWTAGGEPITYLPVPDRDWSFGLQGVDAVLLPGGGDIDPACYGGEVHSEVYDVDVLQDQSDFDLTEAALATGIPVLGVCRGMHILNVFKGGSLVEHMQDPHRHMVQNVAIPESAGLGIVGDITISCYHHQAIREPGEGIEVTARAGDGTAEAISIIGAGWCKGVQWHPEDTWRNDPDQLSLMREFLAQVY